jgi:hypothetical protein
MGYRPEIFRTIFKTTQNPTMPTIKAATAVNTVVAVVVMVEGSANVGPLWAKADAAPDRGDRNHCDRSLDLFHTFFIFPFG